MRGTSQELASIWLRTALDIAKVLWVWAKKVLSCFHHWGNSWSPAVTDAGYVQVEGAEFVS